jgi:hypothetical protein
MAVLCPERAKRASKASTILTSGRNWPVERASWMPSVPWASQCRSTARGYRRGAQRIPSGVLRKALTVPMEHDIVSLEIFKKLDC